MSIMPYLQQNSEEIRRVLDRKEWIKSYEIFLQSNNWINSKGYQSTKLNLFQRGESGFALRILTHRNQLLETNGSISSINRIKEIREPLSTYPQVKNFQFENITKPRIASVPGDQSSSTVLSLELLDNFIAKSTYLTNTKNMPVNFEIDLLKESRLISNSTGSSLSDQALRVQTDLTAKFMIRSLNYSFARSSSGRSLEVNLQPFIDELQKSIETRVSCTQIPYNDKMTIIFHPEVIGRLIIFHLSKLLQNPVSERIERWDANLQFFDDPLMDGGHYSTLFDDQGQLTHEKQIITEGRFSVHDAITKPQKYRVSWFQPTPRSYRYPLVINPTNLVVVGGTGKGEYFMDRPGETLYVKRGYGFTGTGSIESNFVIHANEVEIWKDGTVIGHHDNLTVYGNLDDILSIGQMSSDLYQVVDRTFPGSISLGWFSIPPRVVSIR